MTYIYQRPSKQQGAKRTENTLFLWSMWILILGNYWSLMAEPSLLSSHALVVGHLLLGLHSCSLYRTPPPRNNKFSECLW